MKNKYFIQARRNGSTLEQFSETESDYFIKCEYLLDCGFMVFFQNVSKWAVHNSKKEIVFLNEKEMI